MYICSGQYFYEYRPQTKEIVYRKLEANKMQFQNNFLSFLFGMNAADAKRRYDLKLDKDDENYIYISIQPRFEADLIEFKKAQLVLLTKTLLPRRLWFEHVNGNEISWDVTSMDTTTKLKPADFVAPQPQAWTPKAAATPPPATKPGDNPPPRIVRPSRNRNRLTARGVRGRRPGIFTRGANTVEPLGFRVVGLADVPSGSIGSMRMCLALAPVGRHHNSALAQLAALGWDRAAAHCS